MRLMIRSLYLILLTLEAAPVLYGCEQRAELSAADLNDSTRNTASAYTTSDNELKTSLKPELQAGITSAVTATHYTALVQLIGSHRLEPLTEESPSAAPTEVRIEYVADVLETLRGTEHRQIRFYQVVEQGEAPMAMQAPFIISLCQDDTGYYWPGTGSTFPYSKEAFNHAREVALKSINIDAIEAYCN